MNRHGNLVNRPNAKEGKDQNHPVSRHSPNLLRLTLSRRRSLLIRGMKVTAVSRLVTMNTNITTRQRLTRLLRLLIIVVRQNTMKVVMMMIPARTPTHQSSTCLIDLILKVDYCRSARMPKIHWVVILKISWGELATFCFSFLCLLFWLSYHVLFFFRLGVLGYGYGWFGLLTMIMIIDDLSYEFMTYLHDGILLFTMSAQGLDANMLEFRVQWIKISVLRMFVIFKSICIC